MPKRKTELKKLVPKKMTSTKAAREKGSIASAAQGLIALGTALIGASAVVGNIAYETLAVGLLLLMIGVGLNFMREGMKADRWKNPLAPDNGDIDEAAEDE